MNKAAKISFKVLKVIGWLLLALVILVVALLLFIRSPWGQQVIVDKAVTYVSNKTESKVALDRLFVTFSGNIYLEGLYLEDQQADTLLYSKSLETGVAFLPLIKNGAIHVSKLEWNGLKANVFRDAETERFNFDFIMEALVTDTDTTTKAEPTATDNTASSFPDIELGPINLKDFDVSYQDEVMGIEGEFQLGLLTLDMERLDLNKMDFYIKSFEFNNSHIFYKQTKPFEASEEDTTSAPMPLVIIDQMAISNVMAYYESEPDGMMAEVSLGDFLVELPEADLGKNKVMLKTLRLHDSEIIFKVAQQEIQQNSEEKPSPEGSFEWPDWTIEVDQVSLAENRILYQSGGEKPQEGYFNPEAIDLRNFTFMANNIFLKEKKAGINLETFSFEEISGFRLQEMTLSLGLSDQAMRLSKLQVSTNRSDLWGGVNLEYVSIDELINFPEKVKVNLKAMVEADIKDAYYFIPDLKKNPDIEAVAQKPFAADMDLNGTFSSLNIAQVIVNWGNDTRLDAKGTVGNPMDADRLFLDFSTLDFRTQREDMLHFVNENDLGIRLPEEVLIESEIKGSLDDMVAEVSLQMPEGEVRLDGRFVNTEQIAFNAILQVEELQLNELLQNEQLGTMTFEIHTEGKGSSLENLDAILTSNFKKLEINNADYSGLSLEGEMKNGEGEVDLSLQGEDLDVDLHALANLDSISPKYQLIMDLHGADLFSLGVTSREIRASLKLDATFEGNPEEFDVTTIISDGMVVYDRRPFQLGPVDLTARVRNDTTSLDLMGDMLDIRLRSNASPAEFGSAIQRHISTYLSDSIYMDTVARGVEMEMDLALRSTPILQQVFLEGLEQLDSVHMKIDFKEEDKLLTANIDLPYVLYNNIEIDSLKLRMNADEENLQTEFGLLSLVAGPVSMGRTSLLGEVMDERLQLDFISYQEEETLIHVASSVGMAGDTVNIQIDPNALILNRNEWSIPEDNSILVAENFLRFENFIWSRDNQELRVSNEVEGVEEEHLGISFQDFKLSSFTSLFNPEELIAEGSLDGELILENLFGATGIIAELNVDSLKVTQVPLGNLSLDAKSTGDKGYDFDLALKEGDIDLDLVGDYVAADSGANLNLNLALNELKLIALERLSDEQIRDSEGSISGDIHLSGTTTDPTYEGDFQFNNAVFTVSTLNSRFNLSDESVSIDNSGLYLNTFNITDEENNNFTLDGEVLTEDFTNPIFNLSLNAENFQALNSSREDNDLFYGKFNLNADIDISGDLNQPIINGKLQINDESDLTFIIPETQMDIVERDGVVLFVDRENPDEILTQNEEEQTSSELTGIELSAIIVVQPNAVFNVVVDEASGDNLQLGGEANLSVNMDPNGRITLSGKYEVNKGHYEMSLYNLVSRRFEIEEGSTVTWGGDPMDALLDIRAIYRVETSASELMASQVSGADTDITNQFRQELPFLVYLNVQGELLQPLISFGLDMPEDEQGAIGGNVYTRVQQVNAQEDELNKQVFSLLVLNRFFPATGSDGSGGGTTAMARSSVSQVLSGQLNAYSNSLFGGSGLELDFDLDSFQDYQEGTGQNRTQLNVNAQQRLFNDRLVVQVGSQVDVEGSSPESERGNPVFGNVSVEYLLTENGRYRLRGFRKNQFESIIEGQLIITGLSVIFNREFNKFWELWKGIDPENEEDNGPNSEKSSKPGNENEEGQQGRGDSTSAVREEKNTGIIRNE
ncbi:MAG: translocation/assembly module TamB domain-containing protein [Anditalea sp.]